MLIYKFPKNGREITLSGDQIWFIRNSLGLSQAEMATRLAVTQPTVYRMEQRDSAAGPEVMLIDSMAKAWDIQVPSDPIDRDDPETARAVEANRQRLVGATP